MSDPILRTENLTKRFGGLVAVSNVSLEFRTGTVHAVIGPNGAGKSTLTNLLSGDLPPTSGSVFFEGRNIAGMTPEQISQLGIGRSYQKTNIFLPFTVFENCRLAAQSRQQHAWRIFTSAVSYQDINRAANHAIEQAGLTSVRDQVASALSHGQQRQLEIAMCLSTGPKLLLLDEPLAGMGHHESLLMIELIKKLRVDHAIMLIEHDMDAIFAVADMLTVMVNGEVLDSGDPQVVRSSPIVQQVYLSHE